MGQGSSNSANSHPNPAGGRQPPPMPGGGRYSTLFRVTNFEYFVRANPATIAMGTVGTAIFASVIGYLVYEDRYGALDIGELTAPRSQEEIEAERQARVNSEEMDATSPWNRRRRGGR